MRRTTHWVNLTNGLQAVRDYGLKDYRVMRLQSTYCEQKRWEDILASVPDEFLFRLALGEECRVYDYGARKPVPRAVWQGLEWVKYAVTRRWTGEVIQLSGRAQTMGGYFAEQYDQLGRRTKQRLDYYGKLSTRAPIITSVTSATEHDGNREWFFACA